MRGTLVVARWQEDIGWTRDVPAGWDVRVVQKDVDTPNVGREASSYFWFMATQEIDPDATYAFVQGAPWVHAFAWGELRAVEAFTPIGGDRAMLHAHHDGSPHHGGLPLVARLEEWLGIRTPPRRFSFPAGAQFLVPGRVLLTRPREWYAEMQRRVSEGDGPWVMERLWPHVWTDATPPAVRVSVPAQLSPLPALDLMRAIHGHENPYTGFPAHGEPDLQGWNSTGPVFEDVLNRTGARFVVEVGTWKGASAATMGRILQARGGRLLCVDTWLGAREFVDDPLRRGWLAARHGYPQVYYTFLANMIRVGLSGTVVPFPQTSRIAARWCVAHKVTADAVYLDASHDEEDVADDLRAWWRVLRPGGVLFGDDYDGHWPGVVAAVDAFAAELGLSVEVRAPHWVIAKP